MRKPSNAPRRANGERECALAKGAAGDHSPQAGGFDVSPLIRVPLLYQRLNLKVPYTPGCGARFRLMVHSVSFGGEVVQSAVMRSSRWVACKTHFDRENSAGAVSTPGGPGPGAQQRTIRPWATTGRVYAADSNRHRSREVIPHRAFTTGAKRRHYGASRATPRVAAERRMVERRMNPYTTRGNPHVVCTVDPARKKRRIYSLAGRPGPVRGGRALGGTVGVWASPGAPKTVLDSRIMQRMGVGSRRIPEESERGVWGSVSMMPQDAAVVGVGVSRQRRIIWRFVHEIQILAPKQIQKDV
ncbi:hypothetical protein C8F04DRAFT_1190634 [Mycena alexandri]|uniref:Uncharacterized protein n=1 Tax=Mycena alexandri TaxID=1745969 RepID=A0AAD6SFY4_9AGAR|nr:hypothetical protein C8F04DRAFT_1190634 [Mycena alexandri]